MENKKLNSARAGPLRLSIGLFYSTTLSRASRDNRNKKALIIWINKRRVASLCLLLLLHGLLVLLLQLGEIFISREWAVSRADSGNYSTTSMR